MLLVGRKSMTSLHEEAPNEPVRVRRTSPACTAVCNMIVRIADVGTTSGTGGGNGLKRTPLAWRAKSLRRLSMGRSGGERDAPTIGDRTVRGDSLQASGTTIRAQRHARALAKCDGHRLAKGVTAITAGS